MESLYTKTEKSRRKGKSEVDKRGIYKIKLTIQFREISSSQLKLSYMTMPTQPQPTLEEGLRELHLQLWQQLQSGFSWSDAEQVLLDVWASYARLVEQYVSVPQYNTPWETVRAHVVDVYVRLAKVLGRNSPEAIKADMKDMLIKLGKVVEYPNSPGKKPENYAKNSGPEQHIEYVIKPPLDKDMQQFVYEGRIYSTVMKKFYNVLAKWKSDWGLEKVK
jgi:hypothetical protein